MDPISAIGLAANIAQFVSLGIQLVKRIKDFNSRRLQLPDALQDVATQLNLLTDILRRIETQVKHPSEDVPQKSLDTVNEVTSKASKRVKRLDDILDDILPKPDDSSWAKGKKAISSIDKDSEIEEIVKRLDRYVNLLTLDQVISPGGISQPRRAKSHTIYDIPLRRVATFVGREDLLGTIEEAFAGPSPAQLRVLILQGMGGQGKTQVALEYCRRCEQNERFSTILWANASSEMSLQKGFESISEQLRGPNQTLIDTASRVALVKNTLAQMTQPWLMVFDNYDDPASFPDVSTYFPVSRYGHILLTSRASESYRLGRLIEVVEMAEQESVNLLLGVAGLDGNASSKSHCRAIVRRLGYMPLAIDQAGSFIRQKQGLLPLEDFLAYYEQQTKKILSTTPTVWEYLESTAGEQRERSKSVFTTWELAFLSIRPSTATGAMRAAFVNLLGFFNNTGISEELFKIYHQKIAVDPQKPIWWSLFADTDSQWSAIAFEDVLIELKSLSLITSVARKDDGFIHISIHPLVHDWIRLRQTDTEANEGALLSSNIIAVCLMKYYVSSPLWPESFRLPISKRIDLISQLAAWQVTSRTYLLRDRQPHWLKHPDTDIMCVEQCFAYFYHDSKLMSESLALCQWLLDHYPQQQPYVHDVSYYALRLLIDNLAHLQRSAESEPRLDAILQSYKTQNRLQGREYWLCRRSLALAAVVQGRYAEAEKSTRDCLLEAEGHGIEPTEYRSIVTSLIALLLGQNTVTKYQEAVELIDKDMQTGHKTNSIQYGSEDWEFRQWYHAISRHPNLFIVESLSKELLYTVETQLGVDHQLVPEAKYLRALSCYRNGDDDAAETWLNQSINDTRYAAVHGESADYFELLGSIHRSRKRYDDAMQAYRKACRLCKGMKSLSVLRAAGECAEAGSNHAAAEEIWHELIAQVQCGDVGVRNVIDYQVRLAMAKSNSSIPDKIQEAKGILQDVLSQFTPAPSVTARSTMSADEEADEKMPASDSGTRQGTTYVHKVLLWLAVVTLQTETLDAAEQLFFKAVRAFHQLHSKKREAAGQYISGIDAFANHVLRSDRTADSHRVYRLIEIGRDASVEFFGQDNHRTKRFDRHLVQLRNLQDNPRIITTPTTESNLVLDHGRGPAHEIEDRNSRRSTYGTASVIGSLLDGVFTDHLGWSWCFYINLPIGGLGAAIFMFAFNTPAMFTVTKSLSDSTVVGILAEFDLLSFVFRVNEQFQRDRALIKKKLLACLYVIFIAEGFFMALYYLPIYFQSVSGGSPSEGGVPISSWSLPSHCSHFLSGGLMSTFGHYIPIMITSSLIETIGAGLIYTPGIGSPRSHWIGYQALTGVGLGLGFQVPMIIAQASLDPKNFSALILFSQTIGGNFSAAAGQAAFESQFIGSLPQNAPGVSPGQVVAIGAAAA
ncbi:MAG: hypothetical protein Q9201_002729 [Fulgogasparrea decipioides]